MSAAMLRTYSLSWIDANVGRAPCPGCRGSFPSWTWVETGGLRVLTHDGNTLCPGDATFGALTGPEAAEVAA